MRIAKPILLVSTPIGVVFGLYEAWKIRWYLGLLMLVLVSVIGLFFWLTVKRFKRESAVDNGCDPRNAGVEHNTEPGHSPKGQS